MVALWRVPVIAGACLSLSLAGRAQTPFSSINGVYAIVGARIEIGNGKVIEKGTVVLRDGLIEAVGVNIPVPPEAEIIKGDGLTVYPGFIDAHATRGVTPPEAQPTQDVAPDASASAPAAMREANRKGVRPELRAGDYLTLTDDIVKPARAGGFTTELLVPSGGTINGQAALVNLNGLPRRDSILRPAVAMNFTFHTTGSGYPGSLMGIMALTRQTLLDAQYFQTLQTAFARGGSRRPPADDALAALLPVLSGAVPVLYDANSENEIRRAVRLADEFKLKLMVSGGAEAYKTIPTLKEHNVPVLVSLNFGPEPGVTTPPVGSQNTPPNSQTPGGARPNGGVRPPMPAPGAANPPAGNPPAANPPAKPTTPETKPPSNEKPGQDAGKPVPPKPDKEDTVPPNTPPDQANKPMGEAGARDSAEEEETPPKPVLDERHRKWEEKVANAAKLSQAGIPFAFTTQGTRTPTEFLTNLRRAIKQGLSREAALRALTIDAARILGVDKQMGTIEAGKVAALVVMSGDFVAPASKVRYLFIDKAKFEPDRDMGPIPALPRRRPGDDDK